MYNLFEDNLVDKEAQVDNSTGASSGVNTPKSTDLFAQELPKQGYEKRGIMDTLRAGKDTFKKASGFFGDIFGAGKQIVETKFLNKNTTAGINDMKKFEEYNSLMNMALSYGDQDTALEYSKKLKEENIIDYDKYKVFQDSIMEQSEKIDYRQKVKEELIDSIKNNLASNEDTYIQKVLYTGAEKLSNQLGAIYENIEHSFNNKEFDKNIYLKKMEEAREKQSIFFKNFSDNVIKNNGDYSLAYKKTLEDTQSREIAEELGSLYLNIEKASHKASIEHYMGYVLEGNVLDKALGSYMVLGNYVNRVINKGGELMEKAKQSGLGMYDITEELGNLRVYRDSDSLLKKTTGNASWAFWQVVDASPYFVPELASMFTPGIALKGTKLTNIGKYIDKIDNVYGYKTAVFGLETTMDLVKYDIIGRGMLGRGSNTTDLAEDLLIGIPINATIGMLSSPAKKFNDQFTKTLLAGRRLEDLKVNDQVMDLFTSGKTNEAIVLALRNNADEKIIDKAPVKYNESQINNFRNSVAKFSEDVKQGEPEAKLITTEATDGLRQSRTAEEIVSSYKFRSDMLKDVLINKNPSIKDKENINIILGGLSNNKITSTDIKNKVDSISTSELGLENTPHLEKIAKEIVLNLLGSKNMINQIDLSDADFSIVKTAINEILTSVSGQLIKDKDIFEIGAIYGKYKRISKNEVLNLETGIVRDINTFKSTVTKYNTKTTDGIQKDLESLLDLFSTSKTEIDVSDVLGVSNFLNGSFIKPGVAKSQLNSTLGILGLKLTNGKIVLTKSQVTGLINKISDVRTKLGIDKQIGKGKIVLSEDEFGIFKLLNLEDTYKQFESYHYLYGASNPTTHITGKNFNNYSMFSFFQKQEGGLLDSKYVYDIKDESKGKDIAEYIHRVIKSDISGVEKTKTIKEILLYKENLNVLKKGRNTKSVINEEIENINILKLEDNKPLKNKYRIQMNDFVDQFKGDINMQSIILAALKEGIFYAPAVIYEISNSPKEGQDDFIRDLLWMIAMGKTGFKTGLKMKESFPIMKEGFQEMLSEIKKVYGEIEGVKYLPILKENLLKISKYSDSELKILNTFHKDLKTIYNNPGVQLKNEDYLEAFKKDYGVYKDNTEITKYTSEKSLDFLNELQSKFNDYIVKLTETQDIKRIMFSEGSLLKNEFKKVIDTGNEKFLKENAKDILGLHLSLKFFTDSLLTKNVLNNIDIKDGVPIYNQIRKEGGTQIQKTLKHNANLNQNLFKSLVQEDIIKTTPLKIYRKVEESEKELLGLRGDYIFNTNNTLLSVNTKEKNPLIDGYLNDSNFEKVFITNNLTTQSGKETRINLSSSKLNMEQLDDLLLGSNIKEIISQGDNYKGKPKIFFIGDKAFYTFFQRKGGKIILNTENSKLAGYLKGPDKEEYLENITYFLRALNNKNPNVRIYGIDFNIYEEGLNTYVNTSGVNSLLNSLEEAKLIDLSKNKIEYNLDKKNYELMSGDSAYNNLEFESFLIENKGIAKSTDPDTKRFYYINEEFNKVIQKEQLLSSDDIASSLYLLSPIGNKYYQAIKNVANSKNIDLSNTKIDARNNIVTNFDIYNYIYLKRKEYLDNDILPISETQLTQIKERLNIDTDNINVDDIINIINNMSGFYDSKSINYLINRIYSDISDELFLDTISKLPTYVTRDIIPTKDMIHLHIVTNKLLDNLGINKNDFNNELNKMSQEITGTYLLNNTKNNLAYNTINNLDDVSKKDKLLKYIPSTVTDNYIYGMLQLLKKEGIIDDKIDIIAMVKTIDTELKGKIISNFKGYNTTNLLDISLLDETFKQNIGKLIDEVDPSRMKQIFDSQASDVNSRLSLDEIDQGGFVNNEGMESSFIEFKASLLDSQIDKLKNKVSEIYNEIYSNYLLKEDTLYNSIEPRGVLDYSMFPYNITLLNLNKQNTVTGQKGIQYSGDYQTHELITKFEKNKNNINNWIELDTFVSSGINSRKEIDGIIKKNGIKLQIETTYGTKDFSDLYKGEKLSYEGNDFISNIIYKIARLNDSEVRKLQTDKSILSITDSSGEVRPILKNNINDSIIINIFNSILPDNLKVKNIDNGIENLYKLINDLNIQGLIKFDTIEVVKETKDDITGLISKTYSRKNIILDSKGKEIPGLIKIHNAISNYNKSILEGSYIPRDMVDNKNFKNQFEEIINNEGIFKNLPSKTVERINKKTGKLEEVKVIDYNDITFIGYTPVYSIKQSVGDFEYTNIKGEVENKTDYIELKTNEVHKDIVSFDALDGSEYWMQSVVKGQTEDVFEMTLGQDFTEMIDGQAIIFELNSRIFKLENKGGEILLSNSDNVISKFKVKETLTGDIKKYNDSIKDACQ